MQYTATDVLVKLGWSNMEVLFFYCSVFFVFQPGFVAFVAAVAFMGVWLLWLYHALPCFTMLYHALPCFTYLSIHPSIYPSIYLSIYLIYLIYLPIYLSI